MEYTKQFCKMLNKLMPFKYVVLYLNYKYIYIFTDLHHIIYGMAIIYYLWGSVFQVGCVMNVTDRVEAEVMAFSYYFGGTGHAFSHMG